MPLPHQISDLSGRRFGRLTAVCWAGRTERGQAIWTFRCDCGTEKQVRAHNVLSGDTSSCGCLRRRMDVAS